MEFGTRAGRQPVLDAVIAVPDDAFIKGVDQPHQREGGRQLRIKARSLGNAARHDGRNRRGEGQQEKELDQGIAVLGSEHLGAGKEADPVGDTVADEKIGNGGYREIGEDLD